MAGIATPHLQLTFQQTEHLVALAAKQAPLEICGLLAGSSNTVLQIFPIKNISPDPNRFFMAPQELVTAFYEMDRLKISLQAVYHSHPNTAPQPSNHDISECLYPQTPQLIIGKIGAEWAIRGYLIDKWEVRKVDLHIV
jgi:proteasome lid subunit RPN8/RPN11